MRVTSLAAFLLAGHCVSPAAAAFTLDTTFNGSGQAQDYLDLGSSKADLFADVAIAPATGSLYSVGRVEHVAAGGATFGVLFKRLGNGIKDNAFTNGSSGASRITFGAERSGGSSGLSAVSFDASNTGAVLVAGFNDLNSGKRCGVVYKVLDNAVMKGALDGGFGASGRFTYCASNASTIEFSDIKVLADGRALVTGNGALASGEKYGFALRLTTTGQLDTTFNAGGISGGPGTRIFDIRPGKDDYALRIAVGSQGYYIGGNTVFTRNLDPMFDDDIDFWVARITPAGVLDSSFNGNGKRIEAIDLSGSDKTDLLADLALDANGRVLLLGNINPAHVIYNSSGYPDPNRYNRSEGVVIRLTTGGSRDSTFGFGGLKTVSTSMGGCGSSDYCNYDEPATLITTPTHEILVAGRYVPAGDIGTAPLSKLSLVWISSDGLTAVGEQFSQWTRSEGVSMLRQADGKLVIGGLVRSVSTVSDVDFAVTRFQAP